MESFIAVHRLSPCSGRSCSMACDILVPWPGIEPMSPALQGRFSTIGPPGKSITNFYNKTFFKTFTTLMYVCMYAKMLQLCPTLCDSMDCSPPGSSVHGDSPGNNMKRIAMPSSRGSSWPRDWTRVSCVSCIDRWILYHRTIWEAPEMPQSLPLFFCPPPIIEFEKLRHSFLSLPLS